jgi:hypothetical protein
MQECYLQDMDSNRILHYLANLKFKLAFIIILNALILDSSSSPLVPLGTGHLNQEGSHYKLIAAQLFYMVPQISWLGLNWQRDIGIPLN